MLVGVKYIKRKPSTSILKHFIALAGAHEPPDPGTDRSDLVRDFKNLVGPGPFYLTIQFKFTPERE